MRDIHHMRVDYFGIAAIRFASYVQQSYQYTKNVKTSVICGQPEPLFYAKYKHSQQNGYFFFYQASATSG